VARLPTHTDNPIPTARLPDLAAVASVRIPCILMSLPARGGIGYRINQPTRTTVNRCRSIGILRMTRLILV